MSEINVNINKSEEFAENKRSIKYWFFLSGTLNKCYKTRVNSSRSVRS